MPLVCVYSVKNWRPRKCEEVVLQEESDMFAAGQGTPMRPSAVDEIKEWNVGDPYQENQYPSIIISQSRPVETYKGISATGAVIGMPTKHHISFLRCSVSLSVANLPSTSPTLLAGIRVSG